MAAVETFEELKTRRLADSREGFAPVIELCPDCQETLGLDDRSLLVVKTLQESGLDPFGRHRDCYLELRALDRPATPSQPSGSLDDNDE